MLRLLRNNSKSFVVWAFLGIIIAFFIISFGPQAGGNQFSCVTTIPVVAQVENSTITTATWRMARSAFRVSPEMTIDRLLERTFLARAAMQRGFQISDSYLDEKIAEGDIFIMGISVDGKNIYFDGEDDDRIFNYDQLKLLTKNLGFASVVDFRNEQRQEALANMMRKTLLTSHRLSQDDVLFRYQQDNTSISINILRFPFHDYKNDSTLTKQDVEKYLNKNQDIVRNKYEEDKALYTNRDKEVFVSYITFPNTADTNDVTKNKNFIKLMRIKKEIESGKSFEESAKKFNINTPSNLGWRNSKFIGRGAKVSEAVQELGIGQLSEIIVTDADFHLIRFEQERQGNLSFDQVKTEIAKKFAQQDNTKSMAKKEASKVLKKILRMKKPSLSKQKNVQKINKIQRDGNIISGNGGNQYVGVSEELTTALFDTMKEHSVSSQLFSVSDQFLLVELTQKETPDMEAFNTERDKYTAQYIRDENYEAFQSWLSTQCRNAIESKSITITRSFLTKTDPETNQPQPSSYQICQSFLR